MLTNDTFKQKALQHLKRQAELHFTVSWLEHKLWLKKKKNSKRSKNGIFKHTEINFRWTPECHYWFISTLQRHGLKSVCTMVLTMSSKTNCL